MTDTLYATVRRLLNADGRPIDEPASQPPRHVRFAPRDLRPYPTGCFCKIQAEGRRRARAGDAGNEIGLKEFLHRLRTTYESHVLLYVHGVGGPTAVVQDTERLQKQCDHAEPGLVQVVPVLWPAPDRPDWIGRNNPEADAELAPAAPSGPIAVAVGDVLHTLLNRRDARPPAERKRISVLAHGVGARVLRDALASWADYAGPPYGAFRNVFLTAADIGWHALETGRSGRRLSDAARNLTVYYANDDWAFSSPVTRRQYPAATRRLGQAGPADLAAVATNVYAVDCDDVYYTIDRDDFATESDTSPYFLAGRRSSGTPGPAVSGDRDDRKTPGPVVTHVLHSLRTGRVDADPATRTRVLDPTGKGADR